ncbi:hypothetical protein T4B_14050 [Trichinella pseudospiralis]|uniref:Uncharacterized protein n=1 Tax=Trichinella pseudospiralis TaxID=6337 RepID=A0A0V1EYN0_TRIPS|nr:hypothetical protein T4A_10560 [Trichinella pseudospiralis]KRZ34258.1 hypothetical protein T4B_14050 [Trichinella pseudospiralis]KRZ45737.1 hypothetical protein T4C_13569 [Trichinella pseudospiralis]
MAQINLSEEITMLYSVHEISMYSKNTSNEQRTTAGSSRTRDLLGRVNRPRAVRTFTDLVIPSLPINGSVITPSFHRFRGTLSSTRNTRSPFSGCRPILFHFPREVSVTRYSSTHRFHK